LKKADFASLARIQRSHGNRGELKLRVYAEQNAKPPATRIYLKRKEDFEEFEVESLRYRGHSAFLKLKGIDSLSQADALAGQDVYLPEAAFGPLEEGRYYHFQILGNRVLDGEGKFLGIVKALLPAGETTLLVVEGQAGEFFVPFSREICPDVDLERREIRIDPPEGLLELNEI
jgi:16S rRNA processing protein RimM